ncbi:ABC transporter permease [Oleiagrimonas sp. MCCC 1A03011]|uniref:ABC transporter permease n=1 Tax=Oleiagrimonas sp. MCCC 1A03011 TaxID=1926883 RepID=UPI000DC3D182|nr:ABC transporter permease [Oleiagrimonas sp. MCCC 1A03011]RAP59790.1 peptide ABC transporter permease [Oleiagrimonas sp. MCCC 1A03011]
MFSYYADLAFRSLRRSPGLTVLMVLAIGFGVAATMTTLAVFRAVSGDPIPSKSSRLFIPQVDVWGPSAQGGKAVLPNALDYATARALMRDHRGTYQSAIYKISPTLQRSDGGGHAMTVDGHAVGGEFFPMLNVPFRFGAGWSRHDDVVRANVVVISQQLNQRLFSGRNSVGRTLDIDGRSYRVVGIMKHWNPQPRFFDVVNSGGFSSTGEDVLIPFNTAISAGITTTGNTQCRSSPEQPGISGLAQSRCAWVAYMVQLDDPAAVADYRHYLNGYAEWLRNRGVTHWAPNNRLRSLPQWLDHMQVVPPDTGVSLLVALGLLLVCLANTSGLLLAKFLRRSGEIGVRRAVGAPRSAIYAQYLTEAGMVGLAGGCLGIALTMLGVMCVHRLLPGDIAPLAHVDVALLMFTILVALLSTLVAGIYPTFRATLVQPTLQLKSG